MRSVVTTLACALVAILGCSNPARRNGGDGGGAGGTGGGTLDTLVVTPADVVLDVVDGAPL